MQLSSIWISIGFAVGIFIFLVFAVSEFYGIRYLRSKNSIKPFPSLLFLTVSGNKTLEFIYHLVMLESPFITILVVGILSNNSDITSLILSNWVLILGMAMIAILMSFAPITTDEQPDS